jgi:outer membrane receptor protein involved in Fe transport
LDVQATRGKWSLGVSGRYQSALQNFDDAFVAFERYGFVDWGLQNWLLNHPTLPWIWDARVGYDAAENHTLSLVVSNLANQEYAIRPLAIESPRLISVLYTFTVE